jgi:hypothetical protein
LRFASSRRSYEAVFQKFPGVHQRSFIRHHGIHGSYHGFISLLDGHHSGYPDSGYNFNPFLSMTILILAVLIILVGVIVSAFNHENNETPKAEKKKPPVWEDGRWKDTASHHPADREQEFPYQPPFK